MDTLDFRYYWASEVSRTSEDPVGYTRTLPTYSQVIFELCQLCLLYKEAKFAQKYCQLCFGFELYPLLEKLYLNFANFACSIKKLN